MNGFESERAAAKKAVELVGHQPVMAEDFGPKSHSSEVACIEEVRSSDVYVGILGERYGWITESGKSVTEEEFLVATSNGLPIYFVVSKDSMEPEQQEFKERIGDYSGGYFVGFYDSPEDIKDAVVKALTKNSPAVGAGISDAEARGLLVAHCNAIDIRRRGETFLTAALIPARQDREWVQLAQLESPAFAKAIKRLLLFDSEPLLFNDALGTGKTDGRDYLLFTQRSDSTSDPCVAVGVFQDGSVAMHYSLEQTASRHDFGAPAIIDSDIVEKSTTAFLRFAGSWYRTLRDSQLLTNSYLHCELKEVQNKFFGKLDGRSINQISYPSNGIDDPFVVASATLTLPDLLDGERKAQEMTAQTYRVFKAEGRGWPQANRW